MLPSKFRLIWPNCYRRGEFLKSANQEQESYQVSVHLAEGVSEEKIKM